jgi:hypothetical protein
MWSVRLSDAQRDAVAALIEAQGEVGPSLEGALEALGFARWDELPEADLPWERVEELAAQQGISEADVVWDLTRGMPTPAPSTREIVVRRTITPEAEAA